MVSPENALARAFSRRDHFATTGAERWTFFRVTATNARTELNSRVPNLPALRDSRFLFHGDCLALAASRRCTNASCTQLTHNNVAQLVYTYSTLNNAWLHTGPGSTGPPSGPNTLAQFRPIVANGVKSLAHFSPDGVSDMIVPAASTEDLGDGVAHPTRQCGDVWRYVGLTSGYAKYQACAWTTEGSHDAVAFTMDGQQYLVTTSMVAREYAGATLMAEDYDHQDQLVLKWSPRTQDNANRAMPFGFFLTDQPNPAVGNNGSNVFQRISGLRGVIDVEHFEINGVHFLAFSEHVSGADCPLAVDAPAPRACDTVEIESSIYEFVPTLANANGDCPSDASALPGCQHFEGQFVLLQKISTRGARSMHYFNVTLTGETAHFLAVAEHRDDNLQPVPSTIYKWNGRAFGVFQRVETNFAVEFTSFRENTRTFLAVTNRGCPEIPRDPAPFSCMAPEARARVLMFEPLLGQFQFVAETDDLGHLHTHDTDLRDLTDPAVIDDRFADHELSALPTGVVAFRTPYLVNNLLAGTKRFVLIANHGVLNTTLVPADDCPNPDLTVCHHPWSLFTVATTVSDGLQTQITKLSSQFTENQLYLRDLDSQLSGGAVFLAGWNRDRDLDLRTYAGTSITAFDIGQDQYVALGFERSFLPRDTCLARYTSALGTPSACGGVPIASAAQCQHTSECTTPNSTVVSYDTETVVYKVGEAVQARNFRGELINAQAPRLIEVQRLPSMGVSDLHFFELQDPTTQEAYDACANRSADDCYLQQPRTTRQILAVANAQATCEWNYLRQAEAARDPERVLKLYSWNNRTMQFDPLTQLTGRCQVTAVSSFQVACHASPAVAVPVPTCGVYLVVAEDCRRDRAYANGTLNDGLPIDARVSFHKWNAAQQRFDACQPYPDPTDPRNQAESPCFQAADAQRAPGLVAPADEHQYDFPDLLPTALTVGTVLTAGNASTTDYYPQLARPTVSTIEFMVPQTQKSLFYKDTNPASDPVTPDVDQSIKTLYYANGRLRYELAMVLTFNEVDQPPQAFGLLAVADQDSQCAAAHPTTPRRRQFLTVQRGVVGVTSGGRGAATFERVGLDGVTRSYAVFAAYGRESSLYVHDACAEFTPSSLLEEIIGSPKVSPYGGSLGPVSQTTGQLLCPYSLADADVEAWEAFYNHYSPVSPCKGREANPRRIQGQTIDAPYYNVPPPASKLAYRGTLPATDRYLYPRAPGTAPTVDTHGYAADDYQYLHDHRDDVMTHVQQFNTFHARSVTVKQLCGSGGQVWLTFGHAGADFPVDDSFRPVSAGQTLRFAERHRFYVWNDRYAVPATDRFGCTAAAGTALIAAVGEAFAVLGCFESITFTTPVNTGAAYGIQFYTQGDFLFLTMLNYADGDAMQRDPTLCTDIQTDPSGELHVASAGVTSVTLTLDLTSLGGLQCRPEVSDLALSALDLDAVVNLDTLRQTFVTLDTNQTITGHKTFSFFRTSFAGLTVTGDVDVGGLVDGVDVSDAGAELARIELALLERVTELQAAVCHAQATADTVGLRHAQHLADHEYNATFLHPAPASNSTWTLYQNNLYWVQWSAQPKTWASAEQACLRQGAHLASVHTAAENALVAKLAQGQPLWLGATLAGLAADGSFRYQWADLSPYNLSAGFDPWVPGEPNNAGGLEFCVQMAGASHPVRPTGWTDLPCSQALTYYMCKKPAPARPALTCATGAEFSGLSGQCEALPVPQRCQALVRETACLPKSTLTSVGWTTLEQSFAAYMGEKYPTVSVSHVEFSPYSTSVLFVLRDADRLGLLPSDIITDEFFEPLVCVNDTAVTPGLTTLLKTVRWTELHCAELDTTRSEQLRAQVEAALQAYATGPEDLVEVRNIVCLSDRSSQVQLAVQVQSLFASEVNLRLASRTFWEDVYDQLQLLAAGFWGRGQLEFAPDSFIPDDASGLEPFNGGL